MITELAILAVGIAIGHFGVARVKTFLVGLYDRFKGGAAQ